MTLPAAAHDAPVPTGDLRRNRDFLVVLAGQGVSAIGDAVSSTALPILVLLLTGSGVAMGIVGVLSRLPDLLLGLPAGALADRWDRRLIMLGADAGRAVLTACIPLSVWLGGPTLAVVYAVTFPINVLRVLWLAGYTASVPGLVGRAQVQRANGVVEGIYNLGWILGPILAGVLAGAIGPGPVIALDAATFLVASASLLLVRRPLRPPRRPVPTRMLADIREGVAFVAGHRLLRLVIGLWTATNVVLAGLTATLVFSLTIDRGAGAEAVGAVLAGYAVGSLAGSVIAARVTPAAVGRVMLLAPAVTGLVLLTIPWSPLWLLPVLTAVAGAMSASMIVAYLSLRILLSPDALLGRIGTTARTVSVGLTPVGSLATGLALDTIGGSATLLAMGGGLVAVGIGFSLVAEVRRARLAA